mgnify:CR=1 FL=1
MTKSRRCATCRSRADKLSCSGYPWYSYQDISFCRPQMLWLIDNLAGLRLGIYPPDPEPTGYINNSGGGRPPNVSSHARFETPVQLAAEVDYRLDRTGKDGQLLIAQVLAELDVHPDAEEALRYITGWRRKDMKYTNWVYQVHFRKPRNLTRKI